MNGNLIDTNIIIKVINGDIAVIRYFERIDSVFIPVIALGELAYGASKSSKKEYNLKLFSEFAGEYPALNINGKVAAAYGQIKYDLVRQGVNIPENDIWIAAIAVNNDLELLTCDKHFENIPGLQSVIL